MFTFVSSVVRALVILLSRLCKFDYRRVFAEFVQAFGYAAAASIYFSPDYPLPQDLFLMGKETPDADPGEGGSSERGLGRDDKMI